MTEQSDPNVIRLRVRYVTPEELRTRQDQARAARDAEYADKYRLWQAERLIEETGLAG